MATTFTFPASPTVDQEVTLPDGGKVKWNGYAWVEVPAASGGDPANYVLKAGDSMTGALKLAAGTVAAPALAWASQAAMGWYRSGASVRNYAADGVLIERLTSAETDITAMQLYSRAASANANTKLQLYAQPATNTTTNQALSLTITSGGGAIASYLDNTYALRPLDFSASKHSFFGPGGIIVESSAGANASLFLNKNTATQYAYVQGNSLGKGRWGIALGNSEAESGSNAGSNFTIDRYNDAGTFLGSPLSISRATGTVTIPGTVNAGPATFAGGVTASSLGTGNGAVAGGNGMGLMWDSGSFNYLSMGGGLGTPWSWQWDRTSGTLNWLNSSSLVLVGINPVGGMSASSYVARAANPGFQVTGSASDGGTGIYQDGLTGNPQWTWTALRFWHQTGSWAGFRMQSPTQYIDYYLSGASGYGDIKAATFQPQSDERSKEQVAPLEQQHAAFMGIVPIKWHWPAPPQPKEGDPPIYADLREKWGFSAQNLTKSVALAVYGDVNAVDAEGKPAMASFDPVPVLATTVLEVQALWARIEALEARITQLEQT